jgi:hypothetical protein
MTSLQSSSKKSPSVVFLKHEWMVNGKGLVVVMNRESRQPVPEVWDYFVDVCYQTNKPVSVGRPGGGRLQKKMDVLLLEGRECTPDKAWIALDPDMISVEEGIWEPRHAFHEMYPKLFLKSGKRKTIKSMSGFIYARFGF